MTEQPVVIKGNPTDEEIAAVIAALSSLPRAASAAPTSTNRRADGWSAYWRTLRTTPHPSPDAWRTSLRGF